MTTRAEEAPRADADAGAVDELRRSAEGWHRIELAVIGFIGLCGVLTTADASQPLWLQITAGVLVLSALALACLATYLVGTVAWPLRAGRMPAARGGEPPLEAAGRRLRRSIGLTFVAVALLALGTATSWWPATEDAAPAATASALAVSVADGRRFCGEPAAGPARALALVAGGERIEIPLGAVTSIRPVAACE